ncbi:hybrid cluster-associated redox disulfide protein [Hydrogenispora ethanolica]|uniref:Hybrid cluster-associated redox disulfide protein n=1 Tax=Hydrogenispora ethanolica TaxID=1082276 RepID=A0A4R1RTN5_HYDET|nr:DUF1858 domain-containing protein [Hydrogenispora ethanolica]TCL69352.1 hybrid cluster-associated redox disulfide protein [Hydrogenispora ethanolica]
MITKETRIIDVLRICPEASAIFEHFGMGCAGCMGMTMETIENGAKMHNIPVDELLVELNKATQ